MQSIQSRFFNFMLRNRHILSGKFRKELFDENTSIQAFRDRCEQGAARFARMPEGLEVKPFLIGDMKAERSEERRVGKECRSQWSEYH